LLYSWVTASFRRPQRVITLERGEEREREIDRQIQTDNTDRQTDRQTDRETDRETDRFWFRSIFFFSINEKFLFFLFIGVCRSYQDTQSSRLVCYFIKDWNLRRLSKTEKGKDRLKGRIDWQQNPNKEKLNYIRWHCSKVQLLSRKKSSSIWKPFLVLKTMSMPKMLPGGT